MNKLARSALAASILSLTLVSATFAAQEDHPRIVSVSGIGEVQSEPDQAIVTLGVVIVILLFSIALESVRLREVRANLRAG